MIFLKKNISSQTPLKAKKLTNDLSGVDIFPINHILIMSLLQGGHESSLWSLHHTYGSVEEPMPRPTGNLLESSMIFVSQASGLVQSLLHMHRGAGCTNPTSFSLTTTLHRGVPAMVGTSSLSLCQRLFGSSFLLKENHI